MFGITWVDWLVLVVYLAGITVIGTWAARRVKSAATFFISDRRFGKLFMAFFAFGSGTHSDQAVTVAAKTYHVGASGIWYQWLWLFVTPFYWLIAPLFRRMRAITTSDFFEARYDRSVGVLFALVGMLQLMVNIGLMLRGSSAMISAVSGHAINPDLAIAAMTILFVIYGVAGGLAAAITTDFVQGLLTIVLSFLILPFALSAVGGMAGLRTTIDDPDMFSIVAPGEINAFYISVIAFNALIGFAAQPHSMALCGAGKTEFESRFGLTLGIFLKRFCTVAWMLTGLCAVALYAGTDVHQDLIYGLMAHDLLPQIAPGLVGLFIAAVLASVMSSCDAFMVSSSALFTENVYRPFLGPGRSDRHYMHVGRIVSVAVVACGILFAYLLESVVTGLEIFWKMSAMMGVAFWVGLFWRRATVAGAWAGTLVGFCTLLFTSRIDLIGWDFNARFAQHLPAFMLWEGELYLHWQMILYLTTGFVSLVAVSLLTRPVAGDKLDRLYLCLRTPVDAKEPETKPFTLPENVSPAPRRTLIDHPDFELPRPTLISIIGFLGAWGLVGLMLALVYWIVSLGQ